MLFQGFAVSISYMNHNCTPIETLLYNAVLETYYVQN